MATITAPTTDPADRRGRAGAWALAAALTLTTATQWRLEAAPVGPGEIALAVWIVWAWIAESGGRRLPAAPFEKSLARFWLFSMLGLSAGLFMGVGLGVSNPALLLRDLLALAFAAAFGITVCRFFRNPGRTRDVLIALAVLAPGSLLALLACSIVGFDIPGLALVFPTAVTRFKGWAENPNQIALLLTPLPFALAGLWAEKPSARRAALALGSTATVAWVGYATESDALLVCWGAGAAFAAVAYPAEGVLSRARRSPLVLSLVLALAGCAALALLLNFDAAVGGAERAAISMYAAGDQGSVRFILVENGIRAGAHSPWVGLGPGPMSGLYGPFEEMEAHNTFVDWFASAGALGLALLIALIARGARLMWRAGSRAYLAGFIAILVFGCFHFVARQPIFWLYLIALVSLPATRPEPARSPVPAVPAGAALASATGRRG